MFLYYFQCSDGLHLTQGGNRIVFEEVIAKLREAGLSLETLPVDLPRFDQIDYNDPVKAFEYWTHRRWSSTSFQIRIICDLNYHIWTWLFLGMSFLRTLLYSSNQIDTPLVPKTFSLFLDSNTTETPSLLLTICDFKKKYSFVFFINAMMYFLNFQKFFFPLTFMIEF